MRMIFSFLLLLPESDDSDIFAVESVEVLERPVLWAAEQRGAVFHLPLQDEHTASPSTATCAKQTYDGLVACWVPLQDLSVALARLGSAYTLA